MNQCSVSLPSVPQSLLEIEAISSADEMARHIFDSGLMHDPGCEGLVRRACRGSGENSQLLRAAVDNSDSPDFGPIAGGPLVLQPQQRVKEYQSSPINRCKRIKANPFLLPKAVRRLASKKQSRLRSAVLTDEAARLYRCLAFAMREYGVVMNGHVTIAWEALGIRDHVRAALVLTEFNARMGKWLAVSATGRKRKGVTSATYGVGENYFYVFIHEHASNRGFHTHQLVGITDGKARAFAERAVKVLQRLTGVTKARATAVVFTPGTARDGFAPYMPRFKKNEVERCWIWFRYLAKNLSPHEFKQIDNQCALQREIFRIRRVFVQPQPVTCSDLFGCSQNIGVGAQTKAGFVSKFDSGDRQRLYTDSELVEYQVRAQELERQQELDAILEQIKI